MPITLTIAEAPDGWDESRYGAEICCLPCRETVVTEYGWGCRPLTLSVRCPQCSEVVAEWLA